MKRLYRSEENKIIGGVCGGLGEYFDIDPSIVRIIFVAIVLAGGSGLLIYLILWIILPTKSNLQKDEQESIKENTDEIKDAVEKTAKRIKKEFSTDTAKKDK